MIKIYDYFDELVLFDGARFYPPALYENTMKICTENISVLPNHPYNKSGNEIIIRKADLVFEGITKSTRIIHEYAEDSESNNFMPHYEIIDVSTIVNSSPLKAFQFDGVLLHPLAHVDWYIEANSFALEVP